jgi:hypothetical protein
VHGRRGDYVEFKPEQIIREHMQQNMDNRVDTNGFYDEYRTVPDNVKIYYQYEYVGYADYKPGFYYISVNDLDIDVSHKQRKLIEFFNK